MFETQKSRNKTSSGDIGLNIRTLASPKVGQDQVSGGVSVLWKYCWSNKSPVPTKQNPARIDQRRQKSNLICIISVQIKYRILSQSKSYETTKKSIWNQTKDWLDLYYVEKNPCTILQVNFKTNDRENQEK